MTEYANVADLLAYQSGREESFAEPDRSYLSDGLPPPPPLPVDLFGRWAPWLIRFAASVSAPVDYAAVGLLTSAAACIGASRKVSPWQGWEEYPALWGLLVGPPSASKSPAFAPFIATLKAIETDEREDFSDEHRRFETRKREAQEQRTLWDDEVRKAVKAGQVAPLKPKDADEPDEPKPPRVVVSDATIESLAPIFKANPRGVLLARDELAGWVGGFGKYGGDGDSAFFLERFTGQPLTVDRVKAGHLTAERGLLSVFGGIQPERLAELLLRRPDDGFVARFLYTYPTAAPRVRPLESANLNTLSRALRQLHALALDADENHRLQPRVLPLAADALQDFEQWWKENGDDVQAASGYFAGMLGKAPGLVLRLALILELLEWAATPAGGPEPACVGREALLGACGLFNGYFAPMAARVFGGANRTPEEAAAGALLRHIRQCGEAVVNVRVIQRRRLPGLTQAAAVQRALADLAEGGWVRFVGGRDGEAGRERGDWAINPALWEAEE